MVAVYVLAIEYLIDNKVHRDTYKVRIETCYDRIKIIPRGTVVAEGRSSAKNIIRVDRKVDYDEFVSKLYSYFSKRLDLPRDHINLCWLRRPPFIEDVRHFNYVRRKT